MTLVIKPKDISLDMTTDLELSTAISGLSTVYEAKNSNIQTHISSTSNPHATTKAQVGLSNVDDTSDATKNAAAVTLTNKTLTSPVINSPTGLVKGDVGLNLADNTADINKPITGDVSGTLSTSSVDKIKATPVSATTPTYNKVLKFDGTNWSPLEAMEWAGVTVANSNLALTSTSKRGQIFSGTVGGQTVNLPDATTLSVGATFYFINKSDPLVMVRNSAGTFIAPILPTKELKVILTDNSTSAGSWYDVASGMDYGQFKLYDDFVSAAVTTGTIGALGWTLTTGTVAYQASTGASNGVIRLSTGTGASSLCALGLGTTTPILLNNAITFFEGRFAMPSLGGPGANQLGFQMGLLNATTVVAPSANPPLNAIGFHFDGSGNTPTLTAFSSNAATTTTIATGLTPAINTFYKISFITNAAGSSAYFYLNNAFVGTSSTNMPTTILMAPMMKINSGGTNAAAKTVDIDFYDLQKLYTTLR